MIMCKKTPLMSSNYTYYLTVTKWTNRMTFKNIFNIMSKHVVNILT